MGTDNEIDRARTFERIQLLIEDAYEIAANSFGHAKRLSESGDPGIGAWMYAAEKAIGEIIRLGTIKSPAEDGSKAHQHTMVYEFPLPGKQFN